MGEELGDILGLYDADDSSESAWRKPGPAHGDQVSVHQPTAAQGKGTDHRPQQGRSVYYSKKVS